jgi:lactate permease
VALMSVWQPRAIWRFPDERDRPWGEPAPRVPDPAVRFGHLSARLVARAWMPFALLTLTVLLWGLPPIKQRLESADLRAGFKTPLPILDGVVAKGAAITGHAEPTAKDREEAKLPIVPLSSTGTAVFLAAALSGLLLGLRPGRLVRMLRDTVRRLLPAIATILAMLALGFVTRYSGMDAVLGLACTRTGAGLYPLFGTLLGWLGVALTGSDTSSNVLFGNLQRITAEKLGLSPILMASANTTGGVMGKMIDAQSIVVAAAATGEHGQEGHLLRAVVWHSLALALLVGLVVWLYATVGAHWVPLAATP